MVSSRVTPAAVSGGTGSRDALPIIGCRPDNRLQRVVGDDALVDGPQQYLWRWIEMVAIGQKLYQSCQPENETFRDIFKILSGTEGNCQGHPSELRFDELHKKKKTNLKMYASLLPISSPIGLVYTLLIMKKQRVSDSCRIYILWFW